MVFRILPNLFTIANLSAGIIAIMLAFEGLVEYAAIMVIISMFLDSLDGRIARLFNTQSDFGKELDSLSDIISFGVAPAFIMYEVILKDLGILGIFLVILFPVVGALRLARFNVKPGVPGYFIGLPITAAGGILATITLYYEIFNSVALVFIMVFLSYLMISNIKYPNFKKVGLPRAVIWVTPLIILIVVILALIFPNQFSKIAFLPLGLYALYGIKKSFKKIRVQHIKRKKFENETKEEL
ncbi:MAG: CDP-diacylglycerol--serine O-phosphatidyltransferase [Vulcanibacillus sp.]